MHNDELRFTSRRYAWSNSFLCAFRPNLAYLFGCGVAAHGVIAFLRVQAKIWPTYIYPQYTLNTHYIMEASQLIAEGDKKSETTHYDNAAELDYHLVSFCCFNSHLKRVRVLSLWTNSSNVVRDSLW